MGFDWGNDKDNIQHHGQPEPPVYNLRDVNTKVKTMDLNTGLNHAQSC